MKTIIEEDDYPILVVITTLLVAAREPHGGGGIDNALTDAVTICVKTKQVINSYKEEDEDQDD